MTPLPVELVKLPHGEDLDLPFYATAGSAGMDLLAAINEPRVLQPFERILIPCGFCLALPQGYEAQLRPRSGLALKQGLTVLNTPGTVDADYRGEVKVILINFGQEPVLLERGMRIAQMIIAPFVQVTLKPVTQFTEIIENERSAAGFGSTGLYGSATNIG
jgi:dUTP pyrophosphatase